MVNRRASEDTSAVPWRWSGCSDNVLYGRRPACKARARMALDANADASPSMQHAIPCSQRARPRLPRALAGARVRGERLPRRAASGEEAQPLRRASCACCVLARARRIPRAQSVREHMQKRCRCHGVSGACEFKTCWVGLPPFDVLGAALKRPLRHAADDRAGGEARPSAGAATQAQERATHRHRRRARLRGARAATPAALFTPCAWNARLAQNKSPTYCERDVSTGAIGTAGRACNATAPHWRADSCAALCCGRGFTKRTEWRVEQCACKFVYCSHRSSQRAVAGPSGYPSVQVARRGQSRGAKHDRS